MNKEKVGVGRGAPTGGLCGGTTDSGAAGAWRQKCSHCLTQKSAKGAQFGEARHWYS